MADKKNGKVKAGKHPNSMVELDKGRKPWLPGQSGNLKGRPPDPILIVKDRLARIFAEPYWKKNAKNDETIILILKDAIENYFSEKDTVKKQRWYDLLVAGCSSTGKPAGGEQSENNGRPNLNVIILPNLVPVYIPKPPKADETDFEVID